MKKIVFSCIGLLFLGLTHQAEAASNLTYRHRHFIFTIPAKTVESWMAPQESWTYRGMPIEPAAAWRAEGDAMPALPAGVEKTQIPGWDHGVIKAAIHDRIGKTITQEPGSVTISRSASGTIVFEGLGLPGRNLDVDAAADLTIAALREGSTTVVLPVREIQPTVVVEDEELRKQGVKELVAVGESDYSGSTKNRMHNIGVGLRRFSGHVIPKDATFSFVEVLGPVDGAAGYKKELTILGDKTMPDYGGGLCQVSTTAYRGVWQAGFPIVQRRNHSYTVHYYSPQGTDATIYPPHTDMKFLNDGPSALVMQTHMEGAKAYFLYYGTKDDRVAEVVGPYTWNHVAAPSETKTEYTTDLAPGEKKKVGERVSGMRAGWIRLVQKDGKEMIDNTYSVYEARPLFYQIGVAADDPLLNPPPADEELEFDPSA